MVFQAEYLPRKIEYVQTKTLLHLAEIIAGASLVISNQTCSWWIAAGLGVPIIQESWAHDSNSVIERPDCKYSRNEEEIRALTF